LYCVRHIRGDKRRLCGRGKALTAAPLDWAAAAAASSDDSAAESSTLAASCGEGPLGAFPSWGRFLQLKIWMKKNSRNVVLEFDGENSAARIQNWWPSGTFPIWGIIWGVEGMNEKNKVGTGGV